MHVDGPLLERVGFFLDDHFVVDLLSRGQTLRTLGVQQRCAEVEINFGDIERRSGGDLRDLVSHQVLECLQGNIHAALLLGQALFEGLHELEAGETVVAQLRQYECGL